VTGRRISGQGRPNRRLAPRPLPAHLASALALWSSSRAGVPLLETASLALDAAGERLHSLLAEIDLRGSRDLAEAPGLEAARRAQSYFAGLEAYRRHPYRRRNERAPVLWCKGTTRLLDYGRDAASPVVLLIPSLINRFYILDLLPELSFLRYLAKRGLRPLVIDWGAPGTDERGFDLTDYVARRLDAAFDAALQAAHGPIGVAGYCMGGLLALALALRRRDKTACLALLATPWDFHAGGAQLARFLGLIADFLPFLCDERGTLPVDVIQSLFFMLDPFSAERKFTRFATVDPASEEARNFVALEDWVNDGVPLASAVARDCARSWYGNNDPARGSWQIGGETVDPKRLRRPVLVMVPSRDRIVPPRSAEALAEALRNPTVLRPPLGHIGMMSTARAPTMLWSQIADWLRARLDPR
jgi:polyhydroxyalkanoate synthase